MVDLDAYAQPDRSADVLAARREALLDQMGWLEDEAGALEPLLSALPAWAVEQAPLPTDLSALQTLAGLAALDREVVPAWLDAVEAGDLLDVAWPALDPSGADGQTLSALLGRVRETRADLRARAAAVPPEAWSRPLTLGGTATDLYGLLLALVQHDAERLKELAYRIHEADVTMRPPAPDAT